MRITNGISASNEPEDIVVHAVESIRQAMQVKGCSLFLYNRPTNRLEVAASAGLSREYLEKGPISALESIAESLYQKALDYFPNQRAYLGLGILKQKKGNYAASSNLLARGLIHFPDDPQLNICQGVSLMNTGLYEKALGHFLRFQNIKEAVQYAVNCYTLINDVENASTLRRKLESM